MRKIRFLFGNKKNKQPVNKFNFEDRVIVAEGFYMGCIGYVKDFKKCRGGKIKYEVLLEDGLAFKSKTPKVFEETILRHETEEEDAEENSLNY